MTFVFFKEFGFYIILLISGIYLSRFFSSIFESETSIVISIILIILFIILFYKRRNFRKTKITGDLIIEPDYISYSINSEWTKTKIEEINDLKINYNGYLGLHIGSAVSNGDYNRIRFKLENINIDYHFDLDSKKSLEMLISIFNNWYNRKKKFKEYKFGQRSFLLNEKLSFKEIQGLKDKFEIEW